MSLFVSPVVRATDANNLALSGAKWYFYVSGTTTPASVYTTPELDVAHANPVVSDSGGLFLPIYLDPAVRYRAVLKDASGSTIDDIDPYTATGAIASNVETTSGTTVQDELDKLNTTNLGAMVAGTNAITGIGYSGSGHSGGTSDFRGWTYQAEYLGGYGAVQFNGTNLQLELQHTAGTVATAHGIQGYSRLGLSGSTIGTVSSLTGIEWHTAHEGVTGAITEAYNFHSAGVDLADGTGLMPRIYGFYCSDQGHATRVTQRAIGYGCNNFTAGATISAAFFHEMLSGTNKYGFLGLGDAINVFVGKTRIGATGTPLQELDVQGNAVASGFVKSSGTGGVGYGGGAGGTVTQATSKSTGVTLNKICGQIVMHNASLASATTVSFIVTNSTVEATDVPKVAIGASATAGAYVAQVDSVSAGAFRVSVRNNSGGALGEAITLNFVVIKAVTS